MPTIYIDEQVLAELKRRFGDQRPNEIIRGFLNLPVDADLKLEPAVYLIPHSSDEFSDFEELKAWLAGPLTKSRIYLVASSRYWKNVIADSICLFHKDKLIVGEGRLTGGLEPYAGTEVSPATDKRYVGVVKFASGSIELWKRVIPFEEAERLIGKGLTFRAIQKLSLDDYADLKKASSK